MIHHCGHCFWTRNQICGGFLSFFPSSFPRFLIIAGASSPGIALEAPYLLGNSVHAASRPSLLIASSTTTTTNLYSPAPFFCPNHVLRHMLQKQRGARPR